MMKFIGICCVVVLLTASCKKTLSEVNENPNAPEQVAPQFLLSNVLYQTAKNNAEEGNGTEPRTEGGTGA